MKSTIRPNSRALVAMVPLLVIILKSASAITLAPHHHHRDESAAPSGQLATRLPKVYKLEWVSGPELVRGFGEPKLVSATIDTGDQPKDVRIAKNFSHTFNYDAGDNEPIDVDEEELRALLLHNSSFSMLKKHKTNMTTRRGVKTLIQTKVLPKKRTKSVVMFRDNTIELRGRVRRVLDTAKNEAIAKQQIMRLYENCLELERKTIGRISKSECAIDSAELLLQDEEPVQVLATTTTTNTNDTAKDKDKGVQEFDLMVRSTEVCPKGNPFGTYSLEHYGTNLFKHPAFYTLKDRFVRFGGHGDESRLPNEDGLLDTVSSGAGAGSNSSKNLVANVMSPYDCAVLAMAANKSIALYDMNAITCLFNDQPQIEPKFVTKGAQPLASVGSGGGASNKSGEFLYSANGSPLGAYQLSRSDMLIKASERINGQDEVTHSQSDEELATQDKALAQKWTQTNKCDVISLKEGTYNCIRFPKRLDHQLMFRKQIDGLPKNNGSSVQ